MPDVLTHPCNIGDHHHRWSACSPSLGPLQSYWGPIPVDVGGGGGDRSVAYKVCRITILLEDSGQEVHFLLKVVL